MTSFSASERTFSLGGGGREGTVTVGSVVCDRERCGDVSGVVDLSSLSPFSMGSVCAPQEYAITLYSHELENIPQRRKI